MYVSRRISKRLPGTLHYRKGQVIFDFLYPSVRIWLVGQPMCYVALSMQYKRTTRNVHHYCYEGHGQKFMPACSLITTDYNCLLEIARTPSTALRAWATYALAHSQEAKLAAPAIVGYQSSPCHAVPIAKTRHFHGCCCTQYRRWV